MAPSGWNEMTENWHPIPDFEGHYLVSDKGRVMSLKGGGRKLLSLVLDPSSGYLVVCLRKDGRQRNYSVHRLVAAAFIRPPTEGEHVCHSDGDAMNNALENIRIDTPKGNGADMTRHGTRAIGQRHGCAKLTEPEVLRIRSMSASGMLQRDIAAGFGISIAAIKDIVQRRSWAHL